MLLLAVLFLAAEVPDQLLQRAISEHQKGELPAAIRDYRAYLKARPGSPGVLSNLGAALAKTGDYAAAIEDYTRALEKAENPQVRLNLALALYKTAQIGRAAEEIEKVMAVQPGNQQALLLLADCYLREGENKKVIELLTHFQGARADDLSVPYLLGTALIRDNQVGRGQVIIERILKQGDTAEARLLLGMTKMQGNDYAGAREDLAKAVELNPQLPDVYSYYGLALVTTGDTAQAAEAFRHELQTNPNDYGANLQLGALARQEQKFDEARAYFKRALLVRPGDAAVRYQLATIELAEGAEEKAAKDLEELVKESPNFTEAHVSLATVYYRLKRKTEGDRERATVLRLNAEAQAKQPGVHVK
ncbi:MAG: tetratricopeptide repeat protein [Acidobacteriota bacterium]|nr:tetratricopeptide repeat protein [Acidobacteriota bacterium]